MRNILSIAGKEVKGYFASPIAYLLLTIFSVLFGYFLYIYTQAFVVRGMEMQMQGGNQPMNVNDFAIVPALNTASVIILVPDPHDFDAPLCRRKSSGHHGTAANLPHSRL